MEIIRFFTLIGYLIFLAMFFFHAIIKYNFEKAIIYGIWAIIFIIASFWVNVMAKLQ